jgi:hypothetical protein
VSMGLIESGDSPLSDSCEHGNEPLCSIKGEEFFGKLCNYPCNIFKKQPKPCLIVGEASVASGLLTSTPCAISSRHQIERFKVTAKSYNVATRTAKPRRVKTARSSHRSKASNAVLLT